METIVVVESDPELRDALADSLRRRWAVLAFSTAEGCLRSLVPPLPSVIVANVALPGLSGLELCRRVRREFPALPVLLLGAEADESTRLAGFDAGAADYLSLPLSMAELVLRVRALQRRAGHTQEPSPSRVIVAGGLRIDPDRREVISEGALVVLTRKEFDLLALLAASPGRVFDHAALLARVWGEGAYGSPHTLSVHIYSLRRKIEADPARPVLLVTVRGVGYKFRA